MAAELSKHERRLQKVLLKKQRREAELLAAGKNKKMKKFFALAAVVIAVGAIAFLAFGYFSGIGESALITLSPESFDFGTVSQAKGTVSTVFQISNTGKSDLVINNIVSSCMCTTAVLEHNGEKSPEFGMHSSYPGWSKTIKPGETAQLEVFYNPNVHKDLKGGVTRTVSIYSNDMLFATKTIRISAYQTE